MKKTWVKLILFSGEDLFIVKKCSRDIQNKFSRIGAFVLAILLCCFVSAFLFTDSLFHNLVQDVGIALVWGFIVTNLYVLLLYTISPQLLPVRLNKGSVAWDINLSLILRVGLLVLLAIIVAQPLNVAILTEPTASYAAAIKRLLSTNGLAWLITLLVVTLFLFPVYWKYSIRNMGGFYEIKTSIEKRIIEDDYVVFRQDFKEILEKNIANYNKNTMENIMPFLNKLEIIDKEKYNELKKEIKVELKNEPIEKYEYWADAPYRTTKKNRIQSALSEKTFLTDIYDN